MSRTSEGPYGSGDQQAAFRDKASADERRRFADRLQEQSQVALSASVHHASMSQQYLALAQKFAGLAEQVDVSRLSQLTQLAVSLEREAETGIPVVPVGLMQVQEAHSPAAKDWTGPQSSRFLSTPAEKKDPPANVTPTKDSAAGDPAIKDPAIGDRAIGDRAVSETAIVGSADPARRSASRKGSIGRKRKPKRIRDLAERLRLMAPRIIDRVKVRTRRSDLKPKTRTATEELQKNRRSVFVSTILFSVILILLAVLQLELEVDPPIPVLSASFAQEVQPVEEPLPIEPPAEESGEQLEAETTEPAEEAEEEPPPPEEPMTAEDAPEQQEPTVQDTPVDSVTPSTEVADRESANPQADSSASLAEGRSAESRSHMLQKYGGSAASESAVQRGLEWLASRQRPDGSWDFADVGACGNAGSVVNPIGGTAWALLPFLAAGQTHRDKASLYRRTVEAGLTYLIGAGIRTPAGFDLRGVLNKGNRDKEPNEAYYVHGAATLALCEALLMTNDRRIRPAAEGAIQFLVNSQDPVGGGWRYLPRQPGSTSVTATQVMALAAARKAGLRFPDAAFAGAMHYLDSVQVDDEGRYGYEVQKKTYQASVTAMALLSRMYLGWRRDDGNLRPGIRLLDRRGPYDNLYYAYFATQVMRHWGGAEWERWNARQRDELIRWQEREGPAAGSWTPRDRDHYSRAGGRLLTTCLATLTLEVYYRYQPLLPSASGSDVALQKQQSQAVQTDQHGAALMSHDSDR